MKKYYQTTEIKSEEMPFKKALELGYTTDYRNPNEGGYHIIYQDGSHSWLPKEVFETTYKTKDNHE